MVADAEFLRASVHIFLFWLVLRSLYAQSDFRPAYITVLLLISYENYSSRRQSDFFSDTKLSTSERFNQLVNHATPNHELVPVPVGVSKFIRASKRITCTPYSLKSDWRFAVSNVVSGNSSANGLPSE